jgi:crotonobetainyl-CoA:carnitine CoA-transferase CaiB-like acyl-CoA transferase
VPGALSGIRVLDLTRVLAGPWCTQILGDLGAQVIKIEHPVHGDDTRKWGPPWVRDTEGNDSSDAAYFCSTNRNKHSVTLNLKSGRGLEILRRLADQSDIFIENFKVGGLAKMGLDYPSLAKTNPGLIYLSVTGFGQTGPMAAQPGYDYLIQGFGGLMSITGQPDDAPGGGPQRVGVPIVDINAGLYATIGVLAALYHRNNSGEGQYIDLSLLDSQVAWLANQAMNYLIGGVIPSRSGNGHPNLVPYQPFKTSDGEIIIAVGNDRQFGILCEQIGLAQLASDERFINNAVRVRNRETLVELIGMAVATKSSEFWLKSLPAAGVPCSLINNIAEVFEQPQVVERNMKIDLQHPVAGSMPGVANPLKFSSTKNEYCKAPPVLGEDTAAILESVLGMESGEITALREQQVI